MSKRDHKKAIVLGGSRGIGAAIAASLASLGMTVLGASRKDIDTSDLSSVRKFVAKNGECDVLILNTGGPSKKGFFEIETKEWEQFHRQLFLGFVTLLRDIHIKDGGYIFVITSHHIKQPHPELLVSSAYRLAFWSVLKGLSKQYAERNVSCINLAPGPIKTDRLRSLVADMDKLESTLPLKRAGDPAELGRLVKSIVAEDIKYLNGVTISFDGGLSDNIF